MPMPVAGCVDDLPSDVCCDTLWLIGERIRTIAFNAVCACIDYECHNREMRSWQTEGTIVDLQGDSVVVSFMEQGSRPDSQQRRGGFGPLRVNRAEFKVETRETNWPLEANLHGSTQALVASDPDYRARVAMHARGHAEKMWRALSNAAGTTIVAERMFHPVTHPFVLNRGVAVTRIRPLTNLSNMVGYGLTVTVDNTML